MTPAAALSAHLLAPVFAAMIAPGARPATGPGAADERSRTGARLDDRELELALAQAVDSPELPSEAACLEERPYAMLLRKARRGAEEPTLRLFADREFAWTRLMEEPERFRGRIVYATGVVVELERVEAPGVGRFDRSEVWAVTLWKLPPRSKLGEEGLFRRLWRFRAVRRPGEAMLYVGDKVTATGCFMKNEPFFDGLGVARRAPLAVGPWPTLVLPGSRVAGDLLKNVDAEGIWARLAATASPGFVIRKAAGGRLPTRPHPHEPLISRLVVDVRDDGLLVDGVRLSEGGVRAEVKRWTARHPGRPLVLRAADERAMARGRKLLAASGVDRFVVKELPPRRANGQSAGAEASERR
jgi:hypothetical protein